MGYPGPRVRRSIGKKRRIVELTLVAGASVARVAQAQGVNSHQVFQWRNKQVRARRQRVAGFTSSSPAVRRSAWDAALIRHCCGPLTRA